MELNLEREFMELNSECEFTELVVVHAGFDFWARICRISDVMQ